MQINELLVRNLMQKNPDLSFALEESFPLKSFYASATTLGPITELGADAASSLTPERAAQSLDYWRGTTQSVLADPEAAASTSARDAYAKLILGQANLFLDHKFSGEAEQAYQFATTLSPAQPEAVFGYANLLINQKRIGEAAQLVQTAASLAPDNTQFRDLATQLSRLR
jgi:predicted Zn-dependent protease